MKLIRTEKWLVDRSPTLEKCTSLTLEVYRGYVRALMTVLVTHWPQLGAMTSDQKVPAIERLMHATKKNPTPRYHYFDKHSVYSKMPSYYRRAAIMDALGQTQSYLTRYGKWLDGQRRDPHEKPPLLGLVTQINPSLYKGQCIRYNTSFTQAEIKLWNGADWVWVPAKTHVPARRLMDIQSKALSPLLMLTEKQQVCLAVPFEKYVALAPKIDIQKDSSLEVVCSVDLNVNNTMAASIVRADGTVIDRKIFKRSFDNDQIRQRHDWIRKAATKTISLTKGFCKGWYRKAYHIAEHSAHMLSKALVTWAADHGVTMIVFEHLKRFRPKGGKKRSGLKQRFHMWLHRRLVKFVTWKWNEKRGRVFFVNPANTSKFAFDGSGEVKRHTDNYSLCTFASGKHYNADINATYNIAAKYFLAVREDGEAWACQKRRLGTGKRPVTLSVLWEIAQQGYLHKMLDRSNHGAAQGKETATTAASAT